MRPEKSMTMQWMRCGILPWTLQERNPVDLRQSAWSENAAETIGEEREEFVETKVVRKTGGCATACAGSSAEKWG
jgi:hypothetical protein